MAHLLALDWGTSSMRAFLMDNGAVIESRQSPHGIQKLPAPGGVAGFQAAFSELCGEWLAADRNLPIVTGGMVGSANGWVEAPYVRCPAAIGDLVKQAGVIRTAEGATISVVPGVLLDDPELTPDVIRGEEIQIMGALHEAPELGEACTVVLPGTHSKWVSLRNETVTGFRTYMTGEIFDVLCANSILGRLMVADAAFSDAGFEAGLTLAGKAGSGDLTAQLFSTRSMALAGRLSNDVLKSYLSGLLIGHELVSARRDHGGSDLPIIMIGEGALCDLYAKAMRLMGLRLTSNYANTAPAGLWRFAEARGLVRGAVEPAAA